MTKVKKLNTRAPLDRSPKKNEVERRGGLPMYIRRIANHLHAEKGMPIGRAIATAKNAAQKMCATGDLNFKGKQNVNAASRAEACAAIADWNARIKGSGVTKGLGILTPKQRDSAYIATLINDPIVKREFSAAQRRKLKEKGLTDPHGGFPLAKEIDIKNAIRAIGRAKNPEMEKRRIKARAKELGCEHLIPDNWISKGDFTEQIRTNASANKNKKKKVIPQWEKNLHRGMDPSDERIKANLGNKNKKKKPKKKLKISDKEFAELEKSLDVSLDPDDPDTGGTEEFELRGEITKLNPSKQQVFGWASVSKLADGTTVVDKQGDVLDDLDLVEKVAYDFVTESRDGGEMHVRKGVSTLIESFVSTPEKREKMGIPEGTLPDGWWVGFQVTDSEVWKNVENGKYRMFSVHGTGTRKAYEDD